MSNYYTEDTIEWAAWYLTGYEKCRVGIADNTIIITADWGDEDCRHWQSSVFGDDITWLGFPVEFRHA